MFDFSNKRFEFKHRKIFMKKYEQMFVKVLTIKFLGAIILLQH